MVCYFFLKEKKDSFEFQELDVLCIDLLFMHVIL